MRHRDQHRDQHQDSSRDAPATVHRSIGCRLDVRCEPAGVKLVISVGEAFRPLPRTHWRKIWSTNLLEQDEHWQLEGRRMFSAESRAAIPDLDDIPAKLSASARDVQNAARGPVS